MKFSLKIKKVVNILLDIFYTKRGESHNEVRDVFVFLDVSRA